MVDVERQKSYHTKPTRGNQYNNSITYYNQRKYIKLSGAVWEDRLIDQGKQDDRDYLKPITQGGNEPDKLLANVTVRLKDKSENIVSFKDQQGNLLKQVQTDKDGKYVLWDIQINKLDQYYIEFTYNGMSYENVPVKILEERGSKASEGQARSRYNNQYSTIAKGESRNQNNEHAYNLTYDFNKNRIESKIHFGDNLKYGYTNQKFPINETYSNFLITANTRNAYKNETKGEEGYLDAIYNKEEIRNEAIEEIGNINLGVEERKEIDLKIYNDLNNVQVTINQKNHLYNYNERYVGDLYTPDELKQMTPQVRYESKYRAMSYTRALYPSDVYYGKKDPGPKPSQDEQLKVKVTYEIKLANEKSVTAIINEMSNFYDSKYYGEKAKVTIGKQLNDKGDISEKSKISTFEIEPAKDNNSLHHIKIKEMNIKLEKNQTTSIYIQVEIKQDKIIEIVETNAKGQKEVELKNVAEITSYSLKDEKGNPYAGIDLDSQPGNTAPNNPATFEDDTDQAPGLKLILQENRKIDGMVFIDDILQNNGFQASEINTGKAREGNGRYEGEKGIKDVTVRLIEEGKTNLSEPTSIWKPKQGTQGTEGDWIKAETKTDENGYYQFEGIIPRNYKVVYIWGDKTYKVQDYKSTIVDKQVHEAKNEVNHLEWYKDEFKKQYKGIEWDERKNQEIRVSDAIDNYTSREAIDKQSTIMTNQNKIGINTYRNDVKIEQEDGKYQNLITTIDANTPNFRINVEYSTKATNSKEEYELENGVIKMNGIYAEKAKGHKNYVKNIDFGIAQRAKTGLKLTKEVKRVRIVLDNGIVLSDAKIENGQIKNDAKYVVYLPESRTKGRIKFEVDNELLQNAHLEIQYRIKIDNISEVDYKTKEYYWYGKNHGKENIAQLDTKVIIDYLDNGISVNEEKNGLGKLIQTNEEKENIITKQGLLENTNTMRKRVLEEHNRVLKIDQQISKLLKPGGSHEVTLTANKILMNTVLQEGIEVENQAEIVKTAKTWGSSIITIPGDCTGIDEDSSEIITIVPPTGQSTNTIAYIMLAISSCGILTAGIILIKKYI